MSKRVDLNADMGESFGPWKMGNDIALLDLVTSANIACGFHAGDPDVMALTMQAAVERKVGIGAHPGFADLQGFGRRRLHLSADELANLVIYQLGAAQAVARATGGKVAHLKLHGALANMASEDQEMARCCYQAALKVDPNITILVLSSTAQEKAAQSLGCTWAGEIFADRAYAEDGTLVDRSLPGAVIHDPGVAAQRVVDMVRAESLITVSGARIPARIDTVCLHGDTPEALSIAAEVRAALTANEINVRRLGA